MTLAPKTYHSPATTNGQMMSAIKWLTVRFGPRPVQVALLIFAAVVVSGLVWDNAERIAALLELAVFAAAARKAFA